MANVNENRVNNIISPADDTALLASIGSFNTVLNPYLTALTEQERKSLFSLKEENLVFAGLALQQAQALGTLIPSSMSSLVTQLSTDLDFYTQLQQIENVFLLQALQKVQDTKRLAGHEAYTASLAIYKIIEALASVGVVEAQAAYDILKERFAEQGGAPAQPTA